MTGKRKIRTLNWRALTPWAAAALLVGSVAGLIWVFDGFVPGRLIAVDIPTLAIGGDCQNLASVRATYETKQSGRTGTETRLQIELIQPDCNDLNVRVVSGSIELGNRWLSAFPKDETASSLSAQSAPDVARFDLRNYRNKRSVSVDIVVSNPYSEELSSHERDGLVRRKGYSDYVMVGTTLFEFQNIQQPPELSANFEHDLDVVPHGASILEQVPLSPDVGRSFLINPTDRTLSLAHADAGHIAVESKRNWPMQFRITARDRQRRRDMLIILFSTLIGVGISALLESLLARPENRAA
jgi:hypothetical protein